MSELTELGRRKADHLDICIQQDVGFRRRTTLLEDVEFVHNALPELSLAEVDTGVAVLGRRLRAPLIIAAMTGGTLRAEKINRELAALAQELGIGFAFGSQRPMLTEGNRRGFEVRDVAPDILLLGNIGAVQARETSTMDMAAVLDVTGADALCVHLNPAMELVQGGGDRDFRGCLDTIGRLAWELQRPVIVKETGAGISRDVGRRIAEVGITWVDTSGAGGTSWVGVESLRAQGERGNQGRRFWDWGIPTAASLVQLDGLGLETVATGGVASGMDAARCLALGARLVGIARPVLLAYAQGGVPAVALLLREVIDDLRFAMTLTGCRTPADLRALPLVVGSRLARWVPPQVPLRRRLML